MSGFKPAGVAAESCHLDAKVVNPYKHIGVKLEALHKYRLRQLLQGPW